jgi:spermidine synthase|tara:strand:+ start:530 stop:3160 length:2631 start_codon:yes stop_codon:yes gene_type:complete
MNSFFTSSRFIPYFCLFISGAASLVYELIWIRQLALLFGGTLYAISAVLCAFMAGLALGSWIIGKFINFQNTKKKPVNSILLYGLIEGVIGIYAFLFPYGLEFIAIWYSPLVSESLVMGSQLHWIEFSLSTALMLPATICMGATLPLIGSWSIGKDNDRILSDVSILYSLNTFGAVAGCLFTQTIAIKYFGVSGTNLTAIGMNILVFFLCVNFKKNNTTNLVAKRRIQIQINPYKDDPIQSRWLSLVLILMFMYSGMASLASEILWSRVLVFPMGTTLYAFALILSTFLFGIALGSVLSEKLIGNSHHILKFLIIQLTIAISCIAMLPMFENLHAWTLQVDHLFYDLENIALKTLGIKSLFAFGLMFIPTLGFGLTFPLANRIYLSLFGTVSKTLGNIYALNTIGALMGTILAPFFFIPLMGIRMSLFAIYSLLIVLCFIAMAIHFKLKGKYIATSAIFTIFIIGGGYVWSNPKINAKQLGSHNLARTEINVPESDLKLLEYKEGNFSTLSVIENEKSGARTLYMNGFSTATVSDSIGGSSYMQAMGFVPMVLHPNPKKAMVICFGTGNTTGTVSLFPGVKVDSIEIDKNVLSLAHHFKKWNQNVLEKNNVQTIIQDGRTFTRWTKNKYDVITLEPMSPVQAGTVNLYTKDFYELSANILNKNGIMMQWLPLHLVGPEDARSILKTFQEVFPHTSIWNSFLTRIVLVVGSKEEFKIDKIRFEELMRLPQLKKSAQQIGINSFLDFTDFFIANGSRVNSFVKNAQIITDDRPMLEFSTVALLPPLKWQVDETFINLLKYRVGNHPQINGILSPEKKRWKENFNTRTAQRISVFSRRYNGPGKPDFERKDYPNGLNKVKAYLSIQGEKMIKLNDARWE